MKSNIVILMNGCWRRARQFSTLKREWTKAKRGIALLKDETVQAKNLLNQDGKLNQHQRQVVIKTAKDWARVVPVLGVLALPGGSLLVPLVSKVAPWTLPSTFSYVENEPTEEAQVAPQMARFRKQIRLALADLEQRVRAQPRPDDVLLNQLSEAIKSGNDKFLCFHNLYHLTEENLIEALDAGKLQELADILRLPFQSSDRASLVKELLGKVSKIRASDLALHDLLLAESYEIGDIQKAVRDRGMSIDDENNALDMIRPWIDVTVIRSLPVILAVLAMTFKAPINGKDV